MQQGKSKERELLITMETTRRGAICWSAKVIAGAAAATFSASRWGQIARADDNSVILIADAAEVHASPGSAMARSAAAEAIAARGAARVQAAAALAEGNSEEGAFAQGAAAAAIADPDAGAIAQSAVAVTSASSQDDDAGGPEGATRVIAPVGSSGGNGGRRGGRGMRAAGGRGSGARVGGGRDRERRRDRLASLPSTGTGLKQPSPLTTFLGMASVAAAGFAAIFRGDREPVQAATAEIPTDR